jgi:hypothetical protein
MYMYTQVGMDVKTYLSAYVLMYITKTCITSIMFKSGDT